MHTNISIYIKTKQDNTKTIQYSTIPKHRIALHRTASHCIASHHIIYICMQNYRHADIQTWTNESMFCYMISEHTLFQCLGWPVRVHSQLRWASFPHETPETSENNNAEPGDADASETVRLPGMVRFIILSCGLHMAFIWASRVVRARL